MMDTMQRDMAKKLTMQEKRLAVKVEALMKAQSMISKNTS